MKRIQKYSDFAWQEIKRLKQIEVGPPIVPNQIVCCLTPMLLNIARKNKLKEAGIKIIEER